MPKLLRLLLIVLTLAPALPACKALQTLRELEDALERADEEDTTDPSDADVAGGDPDVPADADVADARDTSDAPDSSGDATIFIDTPAELGEEDVLDAEPAELPVIAAVYPSSGPSEGGTLLTIEGTGFTADVVVTLGGTEVSFVDFVDEYLLYIRTPEGSPGAADLKLSVAGGDTLLENAFTYEARLALLDVEPDHGPLTGGFPMVVRGSGFNAGTRVIVGNREAVAPLLVSDSELRFAAPPGASRGPAQVVVFDNRLARSSELFAYTQPLVLDALVPNVASAAGGSELRVDGAGILEGCTLFFGAQPAVVYRNTSGWPSVVAPGGAPGMVDISVDCGAGGSLFVPAAFEYRSFDGDVTVTGLWPAAGFTFGGEIVTVFGDQMDRVTEVRFGGLDALVVDRQVHYVDVVSPTVDAPGAVPVTVLAGEPIVELEFRYLRPALFTGVEPERGPAAGGWEASLLGLDLGAVDRVIIDERDAELLAVNEDEVRFVVPPGAPGPAPVRVSHAGLIFDSGFEVSYDEELIVQGLFPLTAAASGGTQVYVVGRGLGSSCDVTVDGTPVSVTVLASALLSFVAPPHAPGGASVAVSGCTSWSSADGLVYVDPTIDAGGVGAGDLAGELRVSVIEVGSGLPIEGATVMVRTRPESPWVGLTNAAGEVTFVDDALVGPQTVTAFAVGRSTESVVDVDARHVTLVLNQVPAPPCDPSDPACAPPPPPPTGTIIGFLTGLQKSHDPPPGARLQARISTSAYSPGYPNPDPGALSRLWEDGAFEITTRLGDMALLAYCGHFFEATGVFVPVTMGVVRGISRRPDQEPFRTAIECDIPLNQPLSIKLTNAPELIPADGDQAAYAGKFTGNFVLELGAEGSIDSLPRFDFFNAVHTQVAFPRLDGPLENATFDLTVTASPLVGNSVSGTVYARFLAGYDAVVNMPPFLPAPLLTRPSVEDPQLLDGFIEWSFDHRLGAPDFYQVYITSASTAFSRWNVFVPGYQTEINLADFPEFTDALGELATPGAAESFLSVFIRAIDVDIFDFDNFDRYVLRQRGWNASTAGYFTVTLGPSPVVPEE